MPRLVLDTNIWLDWLVFAEPGVAPVKDAVLLGGAAVYIDEACEAELARVLAYDLGRHSIDAAAQAACLDACRQLSRRIEAPLAEERRRELPQCRDPDDQKFLEAALAAQADVLVTKDQALLELARRVRAFRILTPAQFASL